MSTHLFSYGKEGNFFFKKKCLETQPIALNMLKVKFKTAYQQTMAKCRILMREEL